MSLIDADALKAAITVDGYEHFSGCLSSSEVSLLEMVTDDIDEAPTIDAVPVVRCRECKLWLNSKLFPHNHYCIRSERVAYPDDFCSYGEKKEGAD